MFTKGAEEIIFTISGVGRVLYKKRALAARTAALFNVIRQKISLIGNAEVGVLDEPYSAKHAQRNSHTGPPGYTG